jgi:hypothetical protein
MVVVLPYINQTGTAKNVANRFTTIEYLQQKKVTVKDLNPAEKTLQIAKGCPVGVIQSCCSRKLEPGYQACDLTAPSILNFTVMHHHEPCWRR